MKLALFAVIATLLTLSAPRAIASETRSCGKIGRSPCIPFVSTGWKEIGPKVCDEHLDVWLLFAICGPNIKPGINGRDAGYTLNKLSKLLAKLGSGDAQEELDYLFKAISALREGDPTEEEIRALQAIVYEDDTLESLLDVMREAGMKTMAIGESFSGSIGQGRVEEYGWSFDVNKKDLIRPYHSSGTSRGLQLNAGTDIVISGYQKPNGCIGGTAYGVGASIDIIVGTGCVFWADTNGASEGFSASIGLKGIGGGLAQFVVETELLGIGGCQTGPPSPGGEGPPSGPEPEPVVVTVVRGDTLWAISKAQLGAGLRYTEIFAANQPPLVDPDLIHPGQTLSIPQNLPSEAGVSR